jgi:hypothetical protein
MKAALVVIFFATFAFAHDPGAVSAAQSACGPRDTRLSVKQDATPYAIAQPAAGKALVYMIEDAGVENAIVEGPTVRIGLDGAWAGANHRNSYFFLSVEPGEHHLCASGSRALITCPAS